MMKAHTRILAAILLLVPMVCGAQDEALSEAERDALRAELDQARAEVARAAREIARIQRQLVDEERLTHWVQREEESVAGKGVDRIYVQRRGHLMRPRLGVLLSSSEAERNVVVGLTPGSGAEAAGIQPGDRLVAIDGEAVDTGDPETLRRPLESVESGDRVPVEIEREGELLTLEVEVSSSAPGKRYFERHISRDGEKKVDLMIVDPDGGIEPPAPPLPPQPLRLAGLGRNSDMISNHAGLESYFATSEGVVVLRIDAGNPLKLRDGDVVLSIDGEATSRPVEVGRALMGRGGETVTIELMRNGERITIDAELPETRAVSAVIEDFGRAF